MPKQGKVKVGVIGVGALGRHHARLYKEINKSKVAGIYDVNTENANKVAREFGLKVFDSVDNLLDNVEAVSIAVPATAHHDMAIQCLEKGKHVLVEKPIADSVKDAEEMVKIATKKKLILAVGHTERFNPAMKYIEGQTEKTRFIEAHRLAPYPPPRPGLHRRGTEVGVILDLMIHDLDIVLNMVDSEVERIDAVGIPVLSKTEDISNVRIKFKNGCVANVTASRVSDNPMRRFRVFQTDAYVTLDYAQQSGIIYKKGPLGIIRKPIPVNEGNALHEELEDFVNCVEKAVKGAKKIPKPKVTGQQGLEALRLAVQVTDEINNYNERYGVKFK